MRVGTDINSGDQYKHVRVNDLSLRAGSAFHGLYHIVTDNTLGPSFLRICPKYRCSTSWLSKTVKIVEAGGIIELC